MDTSSTPADMASRGVKVDVLVADATWVAGPHFLLHPESQWPVAQEDLYDLSLGVPDVKGMVAVNVAQAMEEIVTHLIKCFSSWIKLKKLVAEN